MFCLLLIFFPPSNLLETQYALQCFFHQAQHVSISSALDLFAPRMHFQLQSFAHSLLCYENLNHPSRPSAVSTSSVTSLLFQIQLFVPTRIVQPAHLFCWTQQPAPYCLLFTGNLMHNSLAFVTRLFDSGKQF